VCIAAKVEILEPGVTDGLSCPPFKSLMQHCLSPTETELEPSVPDGRNCPPLTSLARGTAVRLRHRPEAGKKAAVEEDGRARQQRGEVMKVPVGERPQRPVLFGTAAFGLDPALPVVDLPRGQRTINVEWMADWV
jgi:hypothetical protein